MWKFEFSRESVKAIEKLDTETVNLIKKRIKDIGSWLDNRDASYIDIKKLKGKWEGYYRLRVRNIRIILTINSNDNLIRIHDIGFRSGIYK